MNDHDIAVNVLNKKGLAKAPFRKQYKAYLRARKRQERKRRFIAGLAKAKELVFKIVLELISKILVLLIIEWIKTL